MKKFSVSQNAYNCFDSTNWTLETSQMQQDEGKKIWEMEFALKNQKIW